MDDRRVRDLAWLAGIIEGEGCLALYNRKRGKTTPPRPVYAIEVTMVDEDVVRRCHKIAGVGGVRAQSPQRDNNQATWRWSVTRMSDVAALLMTLWPMLGERRQARATAILKSWRSRETDARGTWARPRQLVAA